MDERKKLLNIIQNSLNSQNLLKAKQEIKYALQIYPNYLNLLCIANDIYRASGDREKSLEYAELIIQYHPENWHGYGRAAQDLIQLKRFDEAQTKILSGLEKSPNQINLLIIANNIYRASGDREKSLEYAELIIQYHPENWHGYGRAAQDLIQLKRFDEVERLLTIYQGKDLDASSKIKFNLNRRKLVPKFSKAMNLRSGGDYPSFCIAGNCQVAPLSKWLSKNFPYCEINELRQVHLIKNQSEIDDWIKKAIKSDFVFMMQIRDNYGGFKFGSNYIRSLLKEQTKFIMYPNVVLHIFYPFFSYAKNKKKETIRAIDVENLGHQYGDYHDFLAMLLSSKGEDTYERFCDKVRIFQKSTNYSSRIIRKIGEESFKEFEKRNPDFIKIVKSDVRVGINFTFNHPKISALNMIYKNIWGEKLGLDTNDFLELNEEHFERGSKIPIPEFVSKSILKKGNDIPWGNMVEENFSYQHQDLEDYLVKINNCIKFYRENSEIISWNSDNKTLKAAQAFLDEISI